MVTQGVGHNVTGVAMGNDEMSCLRILFKVLSELVSEIFRRLLPSVY
jgi:hypothetical protein